ncbi:MAG: type II secretion system minor pseudopilin GspI [Betaproteobacteria bacterium]|nr:type II secretion system minor pseudopilin GspI [Betaproteobacteria bacterium]
MSPPPTNRALGFTLLEVLVALAILAIVLSAGFRAVGLATGNVQELRERQLAEWVALNRLASHRIIGEFLDTGTYTGTEQQASYTFEWKEEVQNTPNALVRRTTVRVYRPGDDSHALSQLAGFMVRPLQ